MGGGGGKGWFGGTKGASVQISDKRMHQDGKHFRKHGRTMGYPDKKSYDAAAKEFARKYQEHPDAKVFEGKWGGSGKFAHKPQRVITYEGKTVIIEPKTGQIVDFYIGNEYRGLYDLTPVR